MTIVRIGQYPFELNYNETNQVDRDLYIRAGDIYTFAQSATDPYTGVRSLHASSRATYGLGFPFAASDDIRGGWFFKQTVVHQADGDFFRLMESDNTVPLIEITLYNSDDEARLDLSINGAVVEQAPLVNYPPFFENNVWGHHGFHVIGGSRFQYTVDGVAVFDYTDVGVPTGYEGGWFFAHNGWGNIFVDDFWMEIVASESMAVAPSYRYLPSVVDADGTSQDWAGYPVGGSDFEKVDDDVIDDDATYVWIGSANSVEMFNTANITVPLGHSIVSAIPFLVGRKGAVHLASQIRLKADDGVAVANGADQNLPGFHAEVWERMLLDPQSVAWDETSFNACEFGFESRGTV